MSTFTNSVAETNTSASTSYAWMHPISAFLASAGWVQQPDTGQVVWPASIVSITNAVAATGVVTFTYTLLQGAPLRVGNSIKVTNCTTSGLNATYIITSLPLSTTFTAATATTVTEAETAFGGVDVLVSITNAIGNGTTNTYAYTAEDGILLAGQSIVITGCTTSGFNGTFTIKSVGGGSFVTTTGITHATEVETGTGIVTSISVSSTKSATTLPPTNGNVFYEIWGMGDALQSTFPVIIRITFTTGSNAVTCPGFGVTAGTATDGAGNISGVTTGAQPVLGAAAINTNAAATPTYMSGSTNRFTLALWPTTTLARVGFFSIERSHDSSGNDTSTYCTMITANGVAANSQQSFTATAVTTTETSLAAITKHSTLTGSFGSSTLLSPVFPVVGAVGNPLTNVLIGKSADWTDQTQFAFTMYNTSRNYIVCNSPFAAAGQITYDTSATSALIYRYD